MPFEPGPHDAVVWTPTESQATIEKGEPPTVLIDNRSDVSDEELMSFFVENTAMFGMDRESRYMSYAAEGTMMARSKWQAPRNVIEEIELARDLAERDDDVSGTIGTLLAAAYSEGYHNQHEDEQVEHTFGEMSEDIGLRSVLHELHRELLISGQITSVVLFTRGSYDIRPENVSRVINRSVAAPLIAVLPAERVRVVGDDMFGQAPLAYVPEIHLANWLRKFWDKGTSAATKRAMRLENPVRAALFTGPVQIPWNEMDSINAGQPLYGLNPDMVQRSTFPKGSWRYPRPLLTRNLALLEAKRLLNVMDHALLQGGVNYIVVVKKGDEKQRATSNELLNLQGLVQRASRSGVLVGDHRLQIEIVQPELTELLNPEKRRMLGRKLSQALLRVPEFGSDETGKAVETFTELAQRVITDDRALVVGHVQRYIWRATMQRNQSIFNRSDRPTIWMPRVILQGMDFWTQYLLKLYDRGDLPRKYMVEFGGYDYDAVKAQKQREVDNGHDDIFMPPAVPFSSPNQNNKPTASPSDPYRYPGGTAPGPNDNGGGRPRGARTGSPADNKRPSRVVRRTRGETVRAMWSEDEGQVIRIGEITEKIIAEYPEASLGRLTAAEKSALETTGTTNEGNVIVVPVNTGIAIEDPSAVRLAENFSMLVGNRVPDGAIMAVAFCFREPKFTVHEAEDMLLRWGYEVDLVQAQPDGITCPSCGEEQDAINTECENCGYDGPPFATSRPSTQPLALEIRVAGPQEFPQGILCTRCRTDLVGQQIFQEPISGGGANLICETCHDKLKGDAE